ncbi:hypothetical protein VCR31J2_1310058 [Vibrio coralliirubri]|uniref:Uncharacterized protein n=1 Tax=Vibrio coralliirubri TaxID=1516159 RepID=A0AA87C1C3_9VIBR|nr:hypothetical protein VCR31J2_1310058 [Vibrio coralliirubri]
MSHHLNNPEENNYCGLLLVALSPAKPEVNNKSLNMMTARRAGSHEQMKK